MEKFSEAGFDVPGKLVPSDKEKVGRLFYTYEGSIRKHKVLNLVIEKGKYSEAYRGLYHLLTPEQIEQKFVDSFTSSMADYLVAGMFRDRFGKHKFDSNLANARLQQSEAKKDKAVGSSTFSAEKSEVKSRVGDRTDVASSPKGTKQSQEEVKGQYQSSVISTGDYADGLLFKAIESSRGHLTRAEIRRQRKEFEEGMKDRAVTKNGEKDGKSDKQGLSQRIVNRIVSRTRGQ